VSASGNLLKLHNLTTLVSLCGFTAGTPMIPSSSGRVRPSAVVSGYEEKPAQNPRRGRPVHAPVRAGLPRVQGVTPFVSQDAISAIRTKAEPARRLSGETGGPAAKARLAEIASSLEADADKLGVVPGGPAAGEVRRD